VLAKLVNSGVEIFLNCSYGLVILNYPESSRVGGVELVEGVAPADDALAFDEFGGPVGSLAGLGAAGEALAGALVLDVDDGQLQQLNDGVVGREVGEVVPGIFEDPDGLRVLLSPLAGGELREPVQGGLSAGCGAGLAELGGDSAGITPDHRPERTPIM
jgi:hypothetical protein